MSTPGPAELAVVVPVHHEQESVVDFLEFVDYCVPVSTTVYLIADSLEDPTFSALKGFEARHIVVRPVLNGYGPGDGNALRWGLSCATEGAVVVTSADFADDLHSLPEMWEKLEEGYQVVGGSRYMPGGNQIAGSRFRGFLSRLAGLSLHYLAGLPIRDVTSNFKLYHRSVLDDIPVESSGRFEIGMEIAVKAWAKGFQITEVPTSWQDRSSGFKLWTWFPKYLRWYIFCLKQAWLRKA